MRALRVLLVLLSVCSSSGCYVVSLTGLADTSSAALDESLLGKWRSADDEMELELARDEWRTYDVTLKDHTGEQRFTARLATVGNTRFIDLTVRTGIEPGAALLPVHIIGRLTIKDDELSVALLDYDWFRGRLSRGSLRLPAVIDEREAVVITARQPQFRQWLTTNAATAAMFDDAMVFTREAKGEKEVR